MLLKCQSGLISACPFPPYGPQGDSDFSETLRFTNLEVPYTAYNTDDPSLPTLFFPAQDGKLGMALMNDAAEENKPYGAVFTNEDEEQNLVLAFNSEHGLLSRLSHGDVAYHFMNYTATTVDVVETPLDGDSTVYPNLPLSNHAITVIESLTEAFESLDPQPLVLPTEIEPESLQNADWARQGLEVGFDILRTAGLESESSGETLLA